MTSPGQSPRTLDLADHTPATLAPRLERAWTRIVDELKQEFPPDKKWEIQSTSPTIPQGEEWQEGTVLLYQGWWRGFQLYIQSHWDPDREETDETGQIPPQFSVEVDLYTRLEDKALNFSLATFAFLALGSIPYCILFIEGNLFKRLVALFSSVHLLLLTGLVFILLLHFFIQFAVAQVGRMGPNNLTDEELDRVGEKAYEILQEELEKNLEAS